MRQREAETISRDRSVRLRKGERKMLEAIVSRYPTFLTHAQVGTLSGYPAGGDTFRTYLGVLRRHGLVDVPGHGLLAASDRGRAEAGNVQSIASTEDLLAMWRRRLRAGEKKILDHLVSVYPRWVTKDALASIVQRNGNIDEALVHAAFSPETFRTYIGVLKRNRLVEEEHGNLKASDSLFPEAVR